MSGVKTGLDVWASDGFAALRGLRVGAIVNPTSVDSRFRHLVDLLAAAPGLKLQALFGPEHGVRGEAQYMESVDNARDRKTGVPVYSLYGHTFESLTPQREWLADLDALVFDIQDVGSRYYTYIYTMALAMKEAAAAGVRFIVLDRPNPIGGTQVEGNVVAEAFRSFVGLYDLPNRHGLTVGEVARLLNAEEGWGCKLTVVPCQGWRRRAYFDETGIAFVPPSPNMPTLDTALVYPGMCLLEGTSLSEGRGTCRPFEQFGAPGLDAAALAERLAAMRLPGVAFRPVHFTPTFDKHRGVSCGGAMIHVTDRQAFLPLRTAVAAVAASRELLGEKFEWRTHAYEFVDKVPAFDLLCGTDTVRSGIEARSPLDDLFDGFETQVEQFRARREPYLLYP
ncbi:MAG: exo-beta-N-acetylmuramidase NamZ domain-containing protein [Myxococcaceae bacterium]